MRPRTLIFSFVTLSFVFSSLMVSDALGFGYYWCTNNGNKIVWPGKAITLRAAKTTFPSGSTWRSALSTCNGRWNQAPGRFTFHADWNEKYMSRGNSQNEIWATDRNIFDGSAAFCYRRARCYSGGTAKWLEKDIVYDADRDWSNSSNKYSKKEYGGSNLNFNTVTLHEQGHALGLYHEAGTYNIMGSDGTHINANGNTLRHYAGEDAGNGEIFLYGQTGNTYKNDVGVSHWERNGSSGGYSTHNRTDLYYNNGNWFDTVEIGNVEYYQVKAGFNYKVEFTFENNGYYDKSGVEVRWYLSKNDYITTNDTVVKTSTMTLNRNTVYTAKHTIQIPANLAGKTRFVGVIVDYAHHLAEFTNNNNGTYLQVPLRIVSP